MIFAARLRFVVVILLSCAFPAWADQSATVAPAVTATTLLQTGTTWNGVPITYLQSAKPEIRSVLVEIAPGSATIWHKHSINNIAYMLEGEIRLELENGTTRDFKMGEAFAEVVNTWHRGTNIGKGPVKILVVYVGEVGTPNAIPRDDQKQDMH
jgi:quercetin dioxygenase-like cupin family protein